MFIIIAGIPRFVNLFFCASFLHQGLVAIFLKGRTSRPWAESPALVKQNGLPPMRQGLKRKSFWR
jgi:hypothetical protein